MVGLQEVLKRLAADLKDLQQPWALVGGLAVSIRSEPRTTRDVDVAVTVADDAEAEALVSSLRARGYGIETLLEQEAIDRLATARLLAPGEAPGGIIVDLLFASSGIEADLVAFSERLEVLPGVEVPVATTAYLLALKVLAGRTKDLVDIESLLEVAAPEDLEQTRHVLEAIEERGCARNKDLMTAFHQIIQPR